MVVTIADNGQITTRHEWQDKILDEAVRQDVEQIVQWVRANPGVSRHLFHGGDKTHRQLAAALLGKATGGEVYRVDLSEILSKYIGETEKNLRRIFEEAEAGDWILFFDEADALFGKRGDVKDSHDRYANQQTAFLLQRIEDYPGIVILATNLRSHIDDAFARSFQSTVNFARPQR
jgi:SpoVK/Ycf46/Vps4 family AAA+-type ATPase